MEVGLLGGMNEHETALFKKMSPELLQSKAQYIDSSLTGMSIVNENVGIITENIMEVVFNDPIAFDKLVDKRTKRRIFREAPIVVKRDAPWRLSNLMLFNALKANDPSSDPSNEYTALREKIENGY